MMNDLRLIMPGGQRGCEWNPALIATNKFVYYGARHDPDVSRPRPAMTVLSPGGQRRPAPGFDLHQPCSWCKALLAYTERPTRGQVKLFGRFQVPQQRKSGVLVAGDVVFFGEGNGTFDAVDAKTARSCLPYNAPANITNAGGARRGP